MNLLTKRIFGIKKMYEVMINKNDEQRNMQMEYFKNDNYNESRTELKSKEICS